MAVSCYFVTVSYFVTVIDVAVVLEPARDRAIDLHAADLHRQFIQSGLNRFALAVDLERDVTPENLAPDLSAMFLDLDETHADGGFI